MNSGEMDAIEGMIKKYRESRPSLTILVMGPAEDNKDDYAQKCYKKRCQIKDFLEAEKHTVFFPEVPYEEAKNKGDDVPNITVFEKNLIEQSHQVIMLLVPGAPGLESEVNTFSIIPDCARKIYLFYDCDYHPWYIRDKIEIIEGNSGKTEKFYRNDIEKCSLLTKIGVKIEQIASAMSMWPYKKYQGIE